MSGDDDFHQEIVDFINNSKDFKFPSPEEQKKLAELIDQWFMEVDDGTTNEFRKFDSYCEDEDLLKELFFTYFSVNNTDFGLLCFRAAFGFVQDQSIVGIDIFNNISKLRYTDLLQRLDGYPEGEFESRLEAKLFFERTLFPYSKNQEEKEKFLRFFEEEMIFEDDGEPKIKKNKTFN
jgi:hypothetical protein